MTKAEKMTALTQAVRAAFNRLKALSDDLHASGEITTAMRAVMETLAAAGPMTVPQIARAKGVTRQHIQQLADSLTEAGLVSLRENPAHRRSQLIMLTDKGVKAFGRMAAREAPLIGELSGDFTAQDMECATAVLSRLVHLIDRRLAAEADA